MKNIIEIFQSDNNDSLVEVKLDNDTVWLNRNQIATLFNREVKTIGKHIHNIFSEGQLSQILRQLPLMVKHTM